MIILLHSFAWNFVAYAYAYYALRHFEANFCSLLANSVYVWVCAGVCIFANHVFLISLCSYVYCYNVVWSFVYPLKISIPNTISFRATATTTIIMRMIQVVNEIMYIVHKCKLKRLFKYMHIQLRSISRPFFFCVCLLSFKFHLSLVKFDHFVNVCTDAQQMMERIRIVSFLFLFSAYNGEWKRRVYVLSEWFFLFRIFST